MVIEEEKEEEEGGWNGEDARALGRGWRQAALHWKPDQTLCLSEQLFYK